MFSLIFTKSTLIWPLS